jgi:hypothetical protein
MTIADCPGFHVPHCTRTIIYKDEEFYLKMLPKLKEFCMDHLLVQILLINVQINKLRNYIGTIMFNTTILFFEGNVG